MDFIKIVSISLLAFTIFSCDLEKEIEIDLPTYESRLVVECYLEPGQQMTLLLTRTSPYFEAFPTEVEDFVSGILEEGATVDIIHNGTIYPLGNNLTFNPFTNKLFNYSSSTLVPEDFEHDFELKITSKDGESILATTRLIVPLPIDSVNVEFAENDTLARVLTYMTDDPMVTNYFRRVLHESSLDSIPTWSFPLDDRAVEDILIFGSLFDYAVGDTVINTIYSIEEAYFDFLQSLEFAVQSNGNPFAQPSPIVSNLSGTANAIGIFTGITYDRRITIIEE